MSIIQQLKIMLTRLSDELNKLNIDQTMFRKSIEKLSFLENYFILPMSLIKGFKDVTEIINKMNNALMTQDYRDKLKDIILHLSSKIDDIIEVNVKNSRRARLVLTFIIFILTAMGTLFAYYSSIYIGRDLLAVFLIPLYGISIVLFIGIYLRLHTPILLLPTIVLIPLISLFLSPTIFSDAITIFMALFELCCLIAVTIFISNVLKSYRTLIIEMLKLSSSIETFITNINKTFMSGPIQLKEMLGIYNKIYGDKANELIKYVEEISRLRT